MIARVRRWGNSLAVRLRKSETDDVGITEGDLVEVKVLKVARGGAMDLSALPTIQDPDPKASLHHDRYLYGARS